MNAHTYHNSMRCMNMETVRPSKNKKDKAIVTKKGVRVTISIPKDLFSSELFW